MNVFELRERLVADYRDYTRSFIEIRDQGIRKFVDGHLEAERFWPEPLLQLNPKRAECRPVGGSGSRADRLDALRKRCDSHLEQRWLDSVDDGTTQALIDRGYIVIRFHHAEDWEAIFRRRSDVFGAPSA